MAFLRLDRDTPIVHKTSYSDIMGKIVTIQDFL